MKTVIATLESMSPYSQSKYHNAEKMDREQPADYERRTWNKRLHVNEDGFVIIPPMAFKNNLAEAAKFMSIQIKGKGKATYTKHFEAGVLCLNPLVLDIKAEDVKGETLFVPSDGKRGGSSRVERTFPRIDQWGGKVVYNILDEIITEDVFTQHLVAAGQFIGLGRFRPRNNGFYGRFNVTNIAWDI